jgi:hypothetical protein
MVCVETCLFRQGFYQKYFQTAMSYEIYATCVCFFSLLLRLLQSVSSLTRVRVHIIIYIYQKKNVGIYFLSLSAICIVKNNTFTIRECKHFFLLLSPSLCCSLSWLERFFPPIWPYEANMLSFPSFVLSFFFRTLLL